MRKKAVIVITPMDSYFCESLVEVGNYVVDMLGAYAQAYGRLVYALLVKLLLVKLRVCGGGRVYHERLHVGYVCEQREDLQAVDNCESLFLSAFYLEGED